MRRRMRKRMRRKGERGGCKEEEEKEGSRKRM